MSIETVLYCAYCYPSTHLVQPIYVASVHDFYQYDRWTNSTEGNENNAITCITPTSNVCLVRNPAILSLWQTNISLPASFSGSCPPRLFPSLFLPYRVQGCEIIDQADRRICLGKANHHSPSSTTSLDPSFSPSHTQARQPARSAPHSL
jgi:hypothetical protein